MNPEDDLSMEILRRAEKMANETYPEAVRDHTKETVQFLTFYIIFGYFWTETKIQNATRDDVIDGIKRQLLFLVEWAKCIPAFASLSVDDQVS